MFNKRIRDTKNTVYFRPSQEHVHRPHQTALHCHQLFPKHFDNRQPSRAQPITLFKPKNACIYICLIVLPPCDIKALYAVRANIHRVFYGCNTAYIACKCSINAFEIPKTRCIFARVKNCHQLFPKHFGNRQPSRAQPITLLQPENACMYFA